MSGFIPRDFIQTLISRVDIVEIISGYISLKKTGSNFSARCPFHDEKTPSFSVSPAKQFFHCFGCNASGNVLSFVMDYDHLSFVEAVEYLAGHEGLSVPYEKRSQSDQRGTPALISDTRRLYELLHKACQFFKTQLKHSTQTIEYCQARGLSGEVARDFQVGYAPDAWDNMQQHVTADLPLLQECGLITQNDNGKRYDKFRDRLMFPIHDLQGRVIGFGGRIMGDGAPKYLNSPETPVFHKSKALYGFYQILQKTRRLPYALVVEGYMDVLALVQHGIANAVATLGTATSEEHIRLLSRYTDTIIFCFDGDEAGKKAAWRALSVALKPLRAPCQLRFMFMPQGDDPDTFIRTQGLAAFEQLMGQALDGMSYLQQHLLLECDISQPGGISALISKVKEHTQSLEDEHYQMVLTEQLSHLVRIDPERLQKQLWPTQQKRELALKPQVPLLNPIERIAAILIQNPQLITEIDSESYEALQQDKATLQLQDLLSILFDHPRLCTGELLGLLQQTPSYPWLQSLASRSLAIPEAGLLAELKGAMHTLSSNHRQRQVSKLLHQARTGELHEQDKLRLQALIQAQKQKI